MLAARFPADADARSTRELFDRRCTGKGGRGCSAEPTAQQPAAAVPPFSPTTQIIQDHHRKQKWKSACCTCAAVEGRTARNASTQRSSYAAKEAESLPPMTSTISFKRRDIRKSQSRRARDTSTARHNTRTWLSLNADFSKQIAPGALPRKNPKSI